MPGGLYIYSVSTEKVFIVEDDASKVMKNIFNDFYFLHLVAKMEKKMQFFL